jgi:flagellar basal-body rod protein FlgB
MDGLFGKTFDLLSNMLDFRAERHKLITSNIANLDTPGYKPSSLDFKENLDEIMNKTGTLEMTTTHPRHMKAGKESGADFQVSQSDKKVEIDKEMAELAENNIMYNLNVEILSRKFKELNTVLTETK